MQLPTKHIVSRRAVLTAISSSALIAVVRAEAGEDIGIIDPEINAPPVTDVVYIDLQLLSGSVKRIKLGLYGTIVPATVDNFLRLIDQGYRDTKVYRVVSGLTIQLGDVLQNGGKSGRAATESGYLQAENFQISHSTAGIASMVVEKGKVDSRFFLTTRPGDSRYLDGRYVAFGRVQEGMDVLYEIERFSGADGVIRKPVAIPITSCGRVESAA